MKLEAKEIIPAAAGALCTFMDDKIQSGTLRSCFTGALGALACKQLMSQPKESVVPAALGAGGGAATHLLLKLG